MLNGSQGAVQGRAMAETMDATNVDLQLARRALEAEGSAISSLVDQIGPAFAKAAATIHGCEGKVVTTGVGKAGLVARKISATLASTGTQSIFLHPVEALHGDLGRVQREDVIVALSHSGSTEEIIRLVDHIKARGSALIAITGSPDSPLGRHADIAISYGRIEEACPLGLAPTVSTSCMLALGDALALTVMEMRSFTPEQFATYHPAGDLGRRLLKVEEAMTVRDKRRIPVVSDALSLGDALAEVEKVGRRPGAMLLVDENGRLSGILTDADLRRKLLAHRGRNILEMPVEQFMTRNPKCIHARELASTALAILNEYRFDELPVLDDDGRPIGIIDVQDLLGIKTLGNA
jgi:arabinose-5-phosphate isomerase